eukprot:TRINITY_DN13245_c0_g2_i1.p2 TRINITY_DN13245_c0_g2~~TRINITY_DN13245_c0_g2_i1.p2  ORF type:complete len:151 (-),score=10.81 TRINITY_DN13245_c0_g2_i1:306-737(-)
MNRSRHAADGPIHAKGFIEAIATRSTGAITKRATMMLVAAQTHDHGNESPHKSGAPKVMEIAHKIKNSFLARDDGNNDEVESVDSGTRGPPRSRRTAYDLGYDGDINIAKASINPPCGRYLRSPLQYKNGAGSYRQRLVQYSL